MVLTFEKTRGLWGKETIFRPDGSSEIWILAIEQPYPLLKFMGEGFEMYILMHKLS